MSGTAETQTTLSGLFKDVWASKINDLVPECNLLLNMDNFVTKNQREGKIYHQPVLVSLPSGATWVAPAGGNVTLNPVIASQMQDAQIAGSGICNRDVIAFDVAAKAAAGGAQSFEPATALIVKSLIEMTSKFLEIDHLYGGTPVAQTSTVVTAGSTSCVVTISYASWASGLWSGLENASVQFYNTATGALVANGGTGMFTISAINPVPANASVGGTITVNSNSTWGSTTADIAALLALNGTSLDIYFTSQQGNQMVGLKGIMTNTGQLFNINASTYSLWQSNTFPCGNTQFTFGKWESALALGASRGLTSDTMTFVNPVTFNNLVSEQAGARVYDKSYDSSKAEQGFDGLQFFGANGAVNTIKPHLYMHQGEAMIVPTEELKRVGPLADIVQSLTGFPGDFFVLSANQTSWELRVYANQATLLDYPAHAVYINGIVNV
jgi:hypothetical protein